MDNDPFHGVGAREKPSGQGYLARQECLPDAEIYDEQADRWSPAAALAEARSAFATARLPSGEVLVAGGDTCGAGYLDSAELYCEGAP